MGRQLLGSRRQFWGSEIDKIEETEYDNLATCARGFVDRYAEHCTTEDEACAVEGMINVYNIKVS